MKTSAREPGKVGIEPVLDVAERVRMMRDGVINSSSFLISGLIGIFLVPIMFRGLGADLYGLWIFTLSVAGVVGFFDFGLGWSVMREVAASPSDRAQGGIARFVKTAGNVYLLLGVIGAGFIATLGLPLSGGLHLSGANRRIAPIVFALTGVAFFADRILAFTMNVLRGLRRFDTVNLLTVAVTLLQAFGIIVLIRAGTGLLSVAIWQGVATMAVALVGLAVVSKIEPRFRLHLGLFDWNLLRPHLRFALASQISDVSGKIVSEAAPVLIGMVLGSGWIAPYYIAGKFPLAVNKAVWFASGPLFPAAIQHLRSQGMARARAVLEVGTRWVIVLSLPFCAVLLMVTPRLLVAWIGEAQPGTVLVMRLITAGVFVNTIGFASFQMLWGWGAVQTIFIILSGVALTSIGLTLVLLPQIGISGAALGVFLPTTIGTIGILDCACRTCGIRMAALIRRTFDGLLLPAATCVAVVFGIQYLSGLGRWVEVIGASVASGAAYAASLYLVGARQEERKFVQEALCLAVAITGCVYRNVRHFLFPSGKAG